MSENIREKRNKNIQIRKEMVKYFKVQIASGRKLFCMNDMKKELNLSGKQIGSFIRILKEEKNELYFKRIAKARKYSSSKWEVELEN